MGKIFALYPALGGAVASRSGDVVTVANSPGGCYFLRGDNRCGIEVEHGSALKPGICGLFPFNLFSRLGEDIVVIAPHFLCPLRVVLPRSDLAEGTHHNVIQAARDSLLLDRGDFGTNVAPVGLRPGQAPRAALQQEMAFLDACSEGLQASKFFAVLARSSANPESLTDFVRRAALVCGVAPAAPPERDDLDDILLVLASSWRVRLLSFDQERILRILALAEVLIRRLASLSARAPTPQHVERFYSEMFPACRLLSYVDAPLILPEALRQVPAFGGHELTFIAYRALRRAAESNLLAAFEEAFSDDTPTHDRMAILIELSNQLARAIVPPSPVHPPSATGID